MMVASVPVLRVENLTVTYRPRGQMPFRAVDGVTFDVFPGEVLAIVGQSGSGKSSIVSSLVGLAPRNAQIGGRVILDGENIVTASARRLRALRGRRVGFVPQDAGLSLSPLQRVATQISEALTLHGVSRAEARRRVEHILSDVGLHDIARVSKSYPHELSGGMRQRILIGMGVAHDPAVLVADEPTSGLDVSTGRHILDYLAAKSRDRRIALVIVTHDLGIAASRADRIILVDQGKIVETGVAHGTPEASRHRSRQSRSAASPTMPSPHAPLMVVEQVTRRFPGRQGRGFHTAVDGVSFQVPRHATTCLVGESGSGKSTIARMIVGLDVPDAGSIRLDGLDITRIAGDARRQMRRRVQMVYQNPYASLDPRLRVEDIVAAPLRAFGVGDSRAQRMRAHALLERVGLPARTRRETPTSLSGGQRQRVAIARALSIEPELVVLDEPTSALDVVTQAQIMSLLRDLQESACLSYLFISHDLALVRAISDHVVVLRNGQVVEQGTSRQIFEAPGADYTYELIRDMPADRWSMPAPGGGMPFAAYLSAVGSVDG